MAGRLKFKRATAVILAICILSVILFDPGPEILSPVELEIAPPAPTYHPVTFTNETLPVPVYNQSLPLTGSEELRHFRSVVSGYLAEIEAVRTRMLSLIPPYSENAVYKNSIKEVHTNLMHFFTHISQYVGIKTLTLQHPLRYLQEHLRTDYYPYGGSDCDLIERTSSFGQFYSWYYFNHTCQDDLRKLLSPINVTIEYFETYLPTKYLHGGVVNSWYNFTDNATTVTYISVFPNALVTTDGDVRFRDLWIVSKRCDDEKSKLKKLITVDHFFQEVFVTGLYWKKGDEVRTWEDMSRMAPYVDFLRSHPEIRIHVKAITGLVQQIISALGLDPSRLVTGNIAGHVLYLPYGGFCNQPSLVNMQMLSAALRASNPHRQQRRNSIIVMFKKRKDKPDKISVGVRERLLSGLTELVQKHNLTLDIHYVNEAPPLNDSVVLFDRALVVVAPEGVGQGNMLLARPGTPLVDDLCSVHPRSLYFRNLMHQLGHRYFGVLQTGDSEHDCVIEPEYVTRSVEFFIDHINYV